MQDKESHEASGNGDNANSGDNANNADSAGNGVGTGSVINGGMQNGPATVPSKDAQDVESDPALNDEAGQDWTDEGGATPAGPATSST
ncbi:hypothetical protein ART_0320 [Arthrobacter sp. PAMC 25486]|uniref:hypothetical protein n=1 Tax=Arthrobacter sp. PAMC 25486 TaxID=1494608 RepID=UPI000535B13E|nr:hypothetical protein [Arthrobacter sp. PAMC 25486]AIX99918.1 hypothetical protein ART_0320 [Arthrobacter sp. PAMC 25486]